MTEQTETEAFDAMSKARDVVQGRVANSEISRAEDIVAYEERVINAVTEALESSVCTFNPVYLTAAEVAACKAEIEESIGEMFCKHTKFAHKLIEARDRQETRDTTNEHRSY